MRAGDGRQLVSRDRGAERQIDCGDDHVDVGHGRCLLLAESSERQDGDEGGRSEHYAGDEHQAIGALQLG